MSKLIDILGRPRTIKHQIHNRKVSWLELFYDLMFSVVIARLTDGLIDHLSWIGFVNSLLLFGWFIWGWNEVSGYFDNHGNDAILNILIINIEMILTGIGAIFIPEAMTGSYARMAIVFMLIELLMAIVWLTLAHFDHTHGPASRVWGTVHIVALLIMLGSYFMGPVLRLLGITTAFILNVFDVLFANPRLEKEYHRAGMKHTMSDSLIERYGLMTMIALGEVIAGLYETMHIGAISSQTIGHFIAAIILIAFVAAIYYQILGTLEINLPSSIATSFTGWLFIIVILCSYYLGVAMQMEWHFKGTNDQLLGNLSLSVALICFLISIRGIVRIGTEVEKRENHWEIAWLLFAEELAILALAWLSPLRQLVGISIVLMLIIVQGHFLVRDDE